MSRRRATISGLAATLILALPGLASAADPAEIVFASGGRILSVGADGSDRQVLFGKSRRPVNDQLGAVNPEVSPDGRQLAFAFIRESKGTEFSDIWLADGDGTGARRVLRADRRTFYADPTFTPAGELVVSYFRREGRRAETGLARVTDSGAIGRKILVKRQQRKRFGEWTYLRDARFSPDGKKVLYGTTEGEFPDAAWSRLMVLNLETGKSRLLAKQALDGAWSPDGRRVVFTALTWDEEVEVCGDQTAVCNDGGRLKVIDADGTGARPLVSTGGDQRSPDWSEDGRIVFQSAGNMANAAEAYEAFTVKPDGNCLTMLTDGTPASLGPAWVDPTGEAGKASTRPARCGARPALTLDVEQPRPSGGLDDMFWAGPKIDSRLYTGIFYDGRAPYLTYLDCSNQRSSRCGKPFYILQADICDAKGALPSTAAVGRPARFQRGRPVSVFRDREIGRLVYLISGRSVIIIFGGSKGGIKEVGALRLLSETKAEGDLPAAQFPASDIRRMKKVEQAFKATGSVRAVANRLGLSIRAVRGNLRLARTIGMYGDYGTVNCPGE
ncbi:MAG: PD40 domain-containing protein [Solirubrobacterales bacterium]|nr:PD40 domain-containing protein [Solirubrobacterales bacterium]OJU93857.1 MAG: hypothetical protein BGO23_14735 [Solirubrobacterales bacterium 67-14]